MTDIFMRIAERALGLAPTIQPMVAPLYAPSSHDEPFEVLTEQEVSRGSSHTDDIRVTSDSAIGTVHIIPDLPVSKATDTADIPGAAHHMHLPSLERHGSASLLPEQETRKAQLAQRPEQMNLSQPTRAKMIEPATTTHEEERSPFPPIARQERGRTEQSSFPLSPVHLSDTHVTSQQTPVARRELPQTPQSNGENAQRLQRRPLQNDGQEKKAATRVTQHKNENGWDIEQPAPAVPVVHVTIGRIEVRTNSASNAQALAQRQSTAPKTMSLAEYLQQNGKGGRS